MSGHGWLYYKICYFLARSNVHIEKLIFSHGLKNDRLDTTGRRTFLRPEENFLFQPTKTVNSAIIFFVKGKDLTRFCISNRDDTQQSKNFAQPVIPEVISSVACMLVQENTTRSQYNTI